MVERVEEELRDVEAEALTGAATLCEVVTTMAEVVVVKFSEAG